MNRQFPVYLILLISFLIGQEIKWEHYPEKTALNISTDTPGIPIYVDGLQVGVAPVKHLIEVVPGWHRVSYFPDTDNPYKSIFPKDRHIKDIIRMGTINILVEKGQILDVVLNYHSIEEEVRSYQKSVNSGKWIGFTMVMAVFVILNWVI